MYIGTCLRCKRKFEYPVLDWDIHIEDIHDPKQILKCPHCNWDKAFLDERDPLLHKIQEKLNVR